MEVQKYITRFKEETGRLPSQVELSKKLNLSPQAAVRELLAYMKTQSPQKSEKQQETPSIKETLDKTTLFLKGVLVLLSAMAFILSVYFTALWFIGKFHWFISGLISVSMVLFMVISPQTLRYVTNPLIKCVVVVSFFVAMFFSMGSTISGQYNMTTKKLESEPDLFMVSSSLEKQEEEILGLIEEAQKDKEVHQVSITLLSSTEESRVKNWQSIATERKYIEGFDARIDTLREELKSIRSAHIENGVVEEKRDFYLFISNLTGKDKAFVEFAISALPAIFIDLISALCLNLALFIKPLRKRK